MMIKTIPSWLPKLTLEALKDMDCTVLHSILVERDVDDNGALDTAVASFRLRIDGWQWPMADFSFK